MSVKQALVSGGAFRKLLILTGDEQGRYAWAQGSHTGIEGLSDGSLVVLEENN